MMNKNQNTKGQILKKTNANDVGLSCVRPQNSKGITLVALIITIIVMLILVAVSVTIAIKGDLFGTAKRAAKGTEREKNSEQQLANGRVKIDEVWYDSFEDYVAGKPSEDQNESNIKFSYEPKGWTNSSVKVKIEVREIEGQLQYSMDGVEWTNYTEELEVKDNGTKIYARVMGSEEEVEKVVNTIDKEAPIITTALSSPSQTTTSINVEIGVKDSVSGISKIEWYYKKSTDADSEYEKNKKTEEYKTMNGKEAGEKTALTKEKILTELTPSSTYNIYAEVYDVAGNVKRSPEGTSTINVTTKQPIIPPQIGDIVLYEPDPVNKPYKLSGEYSGHGTYDTSVPNTLTTAEDQDISQETTLEWKVLKIHDDGSIDLIGSPTTGTVYLGGPLGYNNGVYLLNDICEKLYSHGNIKARSVRLEDFEEVMTDAGKEARDTYNWQHIQYGMTKEYEGTNTYYPNLYASESIAAINGTVVENGLGHSDNGYDSETTETYSLASKLKLTTTSNGIVINTTNFGNVGNKVLKVSSPQFFVASRCTTVESDSRHYGGFGLVAAASTFTHYDVFCCDGTVYDMCAALRPVVTLNSAVELSVKSQGSSSTPNTFEIENY